MTPEVTVLSHSMGTEGSRAWRQTCHALRSMTWELVVCPAERRELKELAGGMGSESRYGAWRPPRLELAQCSGPCTGLRHCPQPSQPVMVCLPSCVPTFSLHNPLPRSGLQVRSCWDAFSSSLCSLQGFLGARPCSPPLPPSHHF